MAFDNLGLFDYLCAKNNTYFMADFRLRGMGVALVTPFLPDKSIDTQALDALIEHIISGGADFIVVLGTTAETPTLTEQERRFVTEHVRDKVAGRIPLVLGVGSNCTAALVEELRTRDMSGYSAVLSVVPFYNKPQQRGLIEHYTAVADASPLPVILYNVPGRTGTNMTAETTLQLAEHPNIIGVKEASGNFTQIEQIVKHAPEGFDVISGDDGVTFPLMALGCSGVISVIGNVVPHQFSEMVRHAAKGEMSAARELHHSFAEVFRLLFVDGNPAGIKCALNLRGLCQDELRLPLVSVTPRTRENLREAMTDCGLLARPAEIKE